MSMMDIWFMTCKEYNWIVEIHDEDWLGKLQSLIEANYTTFIQWPIKKVKLLSVIFVRCNYVRQIC